MTNITEKTAPNVSVGADTEQSSQKSTANIITTEDENFKSYEEIQREMIRMMDPSYLKTVSMTELYDTVYKSKPPLIDGLLYPGTYIFAGAPKLGKSYLMAQLAYHVSTGTSLWNYTVRKGTALYLALEDDTAACRSACIECLERRAQTICTSLFRQVRSAKDLMNSCRGSLPNTPTLNS